MMITPAQEQYILYHVIILISSIFITWLSIPSSIQISHSKFQHIGQCDIKFFIAFIASLILIIPGNIRLPKLQNVLGYYELPYFPCVILSVLIFMFFINTFNLTDRINSLAATTGIIVNSSFSALCIHLHQYELAAVSLVFVGAISGLLKSNLSRPRYRWVCKHPELSAWKSQIVISNN